MTFEELQTLIANGESRTLELKKSTGELKDGMHTACAFLNTDGGWLVFGVTPSLKIVGQEVTDNTQREIAQALSGFEPAVDIRVEYISIPDRENSKLIAMYFPPFVRGNKPHVYHGCPYYKVESTTKQMPMEMFMELYQENDPERFAWEKKKASRISMEDISEKRVRSAVRRGIEKGRINSDVIDEPLNEVLDGFKLLTADKQPTNAAAFLFGTNTYSYPQFQLRMARFRGTEKSEFDDIQSAEGNFFELLDAGMAFFFKHLSLHAKIVGLLRQEDLEIPIEALRETLINALCHRKYEKYNLNTSIAIYDDRIEIDNPGRFPKELNEETIKLPHKSYPYNRTIAETLYRTNYLENWGSGAKRIIEACREAGVPEPIWEDKAGFITVTFLRPKYDPSTTQEQPKHPLSTPQVPPKYHPSTPQVGTLIEKMGIEYMSMSELIETCGLKDMKSFREIYVSPALEDGAIEREFPASPKHPHQRYRLTDKAIEWKSNNRQ